MRGFVRTSAIIAALALSALVVTGCESNELYISTRIGVRLGPNGGVELVSYACGKAVPSQLEVRQFKPPNAKVWSATTSNDLNGLVVVPADGLAINGWTVDGSIESSSQLKLEAAVNLGPDVGWQAMPFVPADLSSDELTVSTGSYGGKDQVGEEEFIRVNQDWCAKGR